MFAPAWISTCTNHRSNDKQGIHKSWKLTSLEDTTAPCIKSWLLHYSRQILQGESFIVHSTGGTPLTHILSMGRRKLKKWTLYILKSSKKNPVTAGHNEVMRKKIVFCCLNFSGNLRFSSSWMVRLLHLQLLFVRGARPNGVGSSCLHRYSPLHHQSGPKVQCTLVNVS